MLLFSVKDHEKTKLRVMTYNIRYGKGMDHQVDLSRIVDEIVRSEADVIALQEVDRFNARSGMKDQIKELGHMLDMSWVYCPSLDFGNTQYGNAILSKYPIEFTQAAALPSNREQRSVLQANIDVHGEQISVFTTHLGVHMEEREQQLPILLEIVQERQFPSILLGDFNMQIHHSLMQPIKEHWHHAEINAPTVVGGVEIDFVFYDFNVSAIKAWTSPSEASDHDPVIAELYWCGTKQQESTSFG